MRSWCCLTIGLVLGALLVPGTARAQEILLYDVDFGSPPHTVGLPPVLGDGPAPRATPSEIIFGEPLVVAALGALVDQPCAFGDHPTDIYEQMSFVTAANYPHGWTEDYPRYHVEMDVLLESAFVGSGSAFTVLVDAPYAHQIQFTSSGDIRAVVLGDGSYNQLIGTYTGGTPLFLEIDLSIAAQSWTISVDDTPLFTGPYPSSLLRKVRLNMATNLTPDSVAVDNVRISGIAFGLGDMNCDGDVNSYDIDGFICALSPMCDYEAMYPDCDRMLADCNGDGDVNSYDIDSFIALVGGG